jgi:hypothetical protein
LHTIPIIFSSTPAPPPPPAGGRSIILTCTSFESNLGSSWLYLSCVTLHNQFVWTIIYAISYSWFMCNRLSHFSLLYHGLFHLFKPPKKSTHIPTMCHMSCNVPHVSHCSTCLYFLNQMNILRGLVIIDVLGFWWCIWRFKVL